MILPKESLQQRAMEKLELEASNTIYLRRTAFYTTMALPDSTIFRKILVDTNTPNMIMTHKNTHMLADEHVKDEQTSDRKNTQNQNTM